MSNEKSNMPVDPEMPGSNGKNLALPMSADPAFYASKADETLVRLSKLIKTTAGLGSLLSVSSYSLYIAAYLHATSPSRGELLAKISSALGRPTPKLPASLKPGAAAVNPFVPWITILNDTRFSIRLTGLIPMYILLRSLIKQKSPKDAVLHKLALLQASMYITFQVCENIWLLSSKGIVKAKFIERAGGSLAFLKWCCRAWFVALTCDFARLAREATIAKEQGLEKTMSEAEKKQAEKKWWSEFFTVSALYPMAVHYSVDGGIGLNQGLIGLSGFLGGVGGLSRAWAATKD